MRLRFTTGSPFARAVRIVLSEKGLDYEKTEELTTSPAEERNRDAPTLQVPALNDGTIQLWDSLVIIEYLMASYPNVDAPAGFTPFAPELLREGREIEDRLKLATLQTLGTSIAIISQFKWAGAGLENDFAARNAERIGYLLDWLETQISSVNEGFVTGIASVQDICLAVWLMFIDKRPLGLDWQSQDRPKIQSLLERMANRPSFIENPVWWWEPGVVGYTDGGTPIYE